jgi:NADP-reducing hydrogenase subunit HndB
MRTLEDLQEMINQIIDEEKNHSITILVGMATCGISAGAKPVMMALEESARAFGLDDVIIKQTGCIGVCRLEPMFDIYDPVFGRTTYVDMTPEKARKVIESHIINQEIIEEYTIVAYD